ncbi:unnamed protein product [Owenia fusiformis]|uniref:G-protein coupled receptors family 1 profile domain-containing protein n=1 Tax=Owenia fusiformis TaxID=6347 RepID=A0A8S4NJS9_OWEFU|nr:unnamed protein product [Owenia fusiformis]
MEFHIAHFSNINTTNSSDQSYLLTYPPYAEHSPGKFAVYMFFAVTFCILGVFGNILAIISILREKILRVPENMFLVSLAASDILVAGLVLPFSIAGVVLGEEYFFHRPQTCEFLAAVCWLACVSAYLSISGLAINRMILVWFPKLYVRLFTWKTTPFIAFLPWFLTLLTVIPLLTDWEKLEYDPESMSCIIDVDHLPTNIYQFVFLLLSLVTSFVAIVMTAVKIKVVKEKKYEFSAIAPNVLLMGTFLPDAEEEHLHRNVDEKSEELRKYLDDVMITVKMLSCIFIASFIWTPTVIAVLSQHIVTYGRDYWAFACLLGHMQPGLDSFCYIIANRHFRKGFANSLSWVFCCVCCKTKIQK